MSKAAGLIERVLEKNGSENNRQIAFNKLIDFFQDFAFACAYAALKDAWFAKDAAQNAFVTAWQKLDQLRDPKAFPTWFRQIIRTECNRITRGVHLKFSLAKGNELPATLHADPYKHAELLQRHQRIRTVVDRLPENERIVTMLFYFAEHSHAEIAKSLSLPVSTVVKRLFSARKRMKHDLFYLFRDEVRRLRPSRNSRFKRQVYCSLRTIVESDWERTPLRGQRSRTGIRPSNSAYVVEQKQTGKLIAYGAIEQKIYLPQYNLLLLVTPKYLKVGAGDLLLERLEADLKDRNAITVTYRATTRCVAVIAFLKRRGFIEKNRIEEFELNPAAPVSISPPSNRAITITTLVSELQSDSAALRKLHELIYAESRDPSPPLFHAAEAEIWIRQVLREACYVAKAGNEYVGFTEVCCSTVLPDELLNRRIIVRHDYRRQGIATALKQNVIRYARAHGYRSIRVSNSLHDVTLRALHKKLGFRRCDVGITLERCLQKTMDIAPHRLTLFTGIYRSEEQSDWLCTISLEADRLWADFIGQKVELFPQSENTFFITFFSGTIQFEQNTNGDFTQLIWREQTPGRAEVYFRARKES